MKSGSSDIIKPNSTDIDILVSYQAYCISTGCTDKLFREVLMSKAGFKAVRRYYETLMNYISETAESPRKDIIKTVSAIQHITTGEHFAYAFIVLNGYLRKRYGEVLLLSSYDLQEVIRIISGCREGVQKLGYGKVLYNQNTASNIVTIDKIISKSIYDVQDALQWISADCPLKDIVGWILSDWFEYEYDHVYTPYRGLPVALWSKYHNYMCDTIDNAQLIQNSLPMFGVPYQYTFSSDAGKLIDRFVMSAKGDSFHGSHIRLACTDCERAIIFNGVRIHAKKSEVDENILIVNVATDDESYLLSIRKEYLKTYMGLFNSYKHNVYKFGDMLNMNIGSGNSGVLDYVSSQIDNNFVELFMSIMLEENDEISGKGGGSI